MTRSPRTAAQLDARALAGSRREAMRRRARRIRRSVAGLAVTLFAVAFLIVYVQLASGHDPALVANAERRAAASTRSASLTGSSTATESATSSTPSTSSEPSTGSESTTSSEPSGEETSSESSSSGGGETSTGASAVTTSQS